MTPVTDYAALEARVAELEQQMRQILPGKMDAVAYGLSLIHEDARAIRTTVEGHGTRFDAIDRRFDAADARFDTIDRALDEILRQLRG